MKKKIFITLILFYGILFFSHLSFAQVAITGQVRTRTEYRDGQGTLPDPAQDPTVFTSPTVLNDFGIVPAFKHLSEQVSKASKTDVVFENTSNVERLPKTVEINLYRILQEALNNAIKYADANEVKVKLGNSRDYLMLEVADNGKGFSVASINDKKKMDQSGNGIVNIQERTSLIDGQFRIETAPGMGTKIFIKVPI